MHEDEIAAHIARTFHDDESIAGLAASFADKGYAKISELVPQIVKDAIRSEVLALLKLGNRIDITVPETGQTPRKMRTVSMRKIEQNGCIVPWLYESAVLKRFLGRITGGTLHACPWEEERYVIIKQERAGDTHGWHWGDYAYTVIWFIEAPEDAGGELQCVPHTNWDKRNPQVDHYLAQSEPAIYSHKTGDIYLLRSDTTLHRTVPLRRDCTRIILNTCWASDADLTRAKTHETMHQMFS